MNFITLMNPSSLTTDRGRTESTIQSNNNSVNCSERPDEHGRVCGVAVLTIQELRLLFARGFSCTPLAESAGDSLALAAGWSSAYLAGCADFKCANKLLVPLCFEYVFEQSLHECFSFPCSKYAQTPDLGRRVKVLLEAMVVSKENKSELNFCQRQIAAKAWNRVKKRKRCLRQISIKFVCGLPTCQVSFNFPCTHEPYYHVLRGELRSSERKYTHCMHCPHSTHATQAIQRVFVRCSR